MKHVFPTAVKPPKLVKSFAPKLGLLAAIIFIVLSLIHLFRIDTLVPIVTTALGGNEALGRWFVIVVLISEVFALPFLLRMKLSPLAHIVSGFLSILAPLLWTLLAVWVYGSGNNIGFLGSFVAVQSTWWLLVIYAVWLSYSFYTLWSLGYNNLHIKDVLKK